MRRGYSPGLFPKKPPPKSRAAYMREYRKRQPPRERKPVRHAGRIRWNAAPVGAAATLRIMRQQERKNQT